MSFGQTVITYRLQQRTLDGVMEFAWKRDGDGEQLSPTFPSAEEAVAWHTQKYGGHVVNTISVVES